jgi:hypothetical protein
MFSDTFAGIAPASVPGFVVAQLLGGAAAILAIRTLYPDVTPEDAAAVVMPHDDDRRRAGTAISESAAIARCRPCDACVVRAGQRTR